MVFDVGTLDRVAADLGTPVPNGDPDKIFALADQIEASAQKWDGNADELARLRLRLRSALAGDTAEAHDRRLAALLSGPDSLSGDVAAVRAGVAALRNYAADLQDNQWTSRLLAAWLLATMIWGVVSVIATGGESLVEVAVARVRTAAAITALKEVLWRRIAAILTELLVNAGKGVLLGGAEQLVVQGAQVAMGERTSLNGQLIAGTGLSFAEFGVGAEAAEHSVLDLVGDAVKDSRAGGVAAWATSKVLSGMAGNTVATVAGGGSITPETLLMGAALGGAGALGDARGKGASVVSVPEAKATETAVSANAIDTHPAALRFEKQGDTWVWPGETTNDAGPQAYTASAPAPAIEPPVAASEHSAGTPPLALPAPADSGARPVEATTTNTAPPAADAEHLDANGVTAGLDPPPTAHASVGSHLGEGTLDPAITSPAIYTGPLAATTSPAAFPPPLESNAVSAATPTVPNPAPPSPAPTVPSAAGPPPTSPGPTAGLSSPTPDPPAGPADISPASKPSSEPAEAPTAGRADTTATPDEGTTHGTAAKQPAVAQPFAVDPAASAGRPGAEAHLLDRSEGTRADSGRPADPLTARRDHGRPASGRDDSDRPGGARPAKRPGRNSVGRDVPEDLQPAAATRAPHPVAAAQGIGVIKAHNSDSGPGPGDLESNKGGRDGSGGDNASDPGAAAGGAGGYRGGDGGRGGGAGGDSGDGGVGPGDGSDAGDPSDRGDRGGAGEEPGRNDLHHRDNGDDSGVSKPGETGGPNQPRGHTGDDPTQQPGGNATGLSPHDRDATGGPVHIARASDGEIVGLVLHAGAGDVAAENTLRDIYGPRVDQAVRDVTGNPTTADALTMTIFAQAFSALRDERATEDPKRDFETRLAQASTGGRVFGDWLRNTRELLELSQRNVAERADATQSHISLIELGQKPRRGVAKRLVAALGLRADEASKVFNHFFPLPVVKPLTEYRGVFGDWLRDTRESLELIEDEVALRAGLSRAEVSHVELGRTKPSRDTAERLVAAVGLSGEELRELVDHFVPVPAVRALIEHTEVFGQWLRTTRQSLGWSQREVAERAEASRVHVKDVERGRTRPSTDLAERLIAAVGCTVEQARQAIMRVLVEKEYPDLRGRAVELVRSVRTWRDGHFETSSHYPADGEVADALGLSLEQVTFARGVIDRHRSVSIENEYSGRGHTANPVFEPTFSDSEVMDFIGTVLVGLPPAEIETILHHIAFGGPVTLVAERLGTDAVTDGARVETTKQRLRAAFGSSDSGDVDRYARQDNTPRPGEPGKDSTTEPAQGMAAHLVPVGPVKPLTEYGDDFAEWLRDKRRSLDWTMEVLDARAGLSHGHVGRIERGGKPSRDTAAQLVSALGLSGEALWEVVDHFVPVPAVQALIENPEVFGRWLRTTRQSLGWRLRDVAERAEASKGYVSAVELGVRPSPDLAERLVAAVGFTVDQARQAIMRAEFEL